MVPNEALTNALRSLGFRYKDRSDRMVIHKQSGSVNPVMVRRHANHSDEYASQILRQAGMEAEDIESFLRSAGVTSH